MRSVTDERTCETTTVTAPTNPRETPETELSWVPLSASAALLLGIVLVFAGLWMVTAGGPLPLGWLFFAAGLATSIVGGVAYGVAWGLELHDNRQR